MLKTSLSQQGWRTMLSRVSYGNKEMCMSCGLLCFLLRKQLLNGVCCVLMRVCVCMCVHITCVTPRCWTSVLPWVISCLTHGSTVNQQGIPTKVFAYVSGFLAKIAWDFGLLWLLTYKYTCTIHFIYVELMLLYRNMGLHISTTTIYHYNFLLGRILVH